MTIVLRTALFALLIPLLASCLQAETTVRVKPDGSGTLTERIVFAHDTVALLQEMAPEGEPFQLLDEAWLRDQAGKYGEGVRLVSAQPLETDAGKGYEASYSFADVNALRLDTDPGSKIPSDGSGGGPERAPEIATFALEPGAPASLLINWPIEPPGSGGEAAPESEPAEEPAMEPAPEELEMVKEMMGNLRMTVAVEVDGEILETNATHREGSRVTLFDFDFAALLSNEAGLQALVSKEPETLAELKAVMEKIPGLKLEIEPEVTIRFQ